MVRAMHQQEENDTYSTNYAIKHPKIGCPASVRKHLQAALAYALRALPFGILALLICFRHRLEAALDALAVGFELLLVAEGELDGSTSVVVGVADAPLEVALIAPVDELEVAAVDDKPWRVGVCLDDVAQLGVGILEASWWVLLHRALQEVIEGARGGLLLAMGSNT